MCSFSLSAWTINGPNEAGVIDSEPAIALSRGTTNPLKKDSEFSRMSGLQLPGAYQIRSRNKIMTEKDIVNPEELGTESKFSRSIPNIIKSIPSKIIGKILGEMPEIEDRLDSSDMGVIESVVSLPHWISKRQKDFSPIYERQLKRMDEKFKALQESLEESEPFFAEMSKGEEKALSDIIWKIDGQKLKGMDADKFISVKDEKGRPLRENGRVVLEMNPEYYEAFKTWVKKQKVSDKVKAALVAVRTSLDNDFLRAYNAMRSMSEISDDTIKEFRTNINHIHNYFPHKRYGKYNIQGIGLNKVDKTENGKWAVFNQLGHQLSKDFSDKNVATQFLLKNRKSVVYREHFDATTKGLARIKAAKMVKSLKTEYPDLDWSKGENKDLPDDIYANPIDTNAMEQIINAATSKLDNEKKASEIKAALAQSISDIMKTRGWSAASIGRKNIPGFERDNIRGVLFDYKSGLTGWLTKMSAARDFSNLLGKIDAKNNPKLYTYSTTYVRNMLRNADRIDSVVGKIKAIAFLWYLGGNLKTAALNLTQNVITGVPRLGMDVKGSGRKYINAAMDTITDALTKGKKLQKDEAQLLNDLYKEDVITEGFLNEVRGKAKRDGMSNLWNKVIKAAGAPMAVAERFNRASLALAAYRAARDGQLKNGSEAMVYDEAKAFSETIVRDSHFVYGKSNLPQPLRNSDLGRAINPAYTFRTFSQNLLSIWNWMLSSQGTEGKKAFAKSMMGTAAIGGFTALPFYSTLMSLFQWSTGDDDDWTEEIRHKLPENEMLRDLVTYGLPAVAGVSLGGSIGLETPVLSNIKPGETASDAVKNNIGEIIGIPWDLLFQKPARFKKALASGDNLRAFEEVAPTIIKNALAGFRLYTKGKTTLSGMPIFDPISGEQRLSGLESLSKAFGFQPVSSTKSYEAYSARSVSEAVRKEKGDGLASRFAQALRDRDKKKALDTLKELRKWNVEKMKEAKPWLLITPQSFESSVKIRLQGHNLNKRDMLRAVGQMRAY